MNRKMEKLQGNANWRKIEDITFILHFFLMDFFIDSLNNDMLGAYITVIFHNF